jgi:hypothetical protein
LPDEANLLSASRKKSEIRKRKPRRIKDHNREPKGNFDGLLAKFTYESTLPDTLKG